MNRRELILDFTSLLDVVMIILFFFILFGHFEAKNEVENEKERVRAEVQDKLDEADEALASAREKDGLAAGLLEEAEKAKERSGNNVQGIMEMSRNANIRLKLESAADKSWTLTVCQGEEQKASIETCSAEELAEKLTSLMSELGYAPEETILCEFIYNGSESGSRRACMVMRDAFDSVKKKYEHFFYSEINLSSFSKEN